MGLVADTSVLVAIERGADATGDEPVVIPAIVYGELLLGVALTAAATALELGFAVLVGPGDEQHFRRVPGLVVRVLSV